MKEQNKETTPSRPEWEERFDDVFGMDTIFFELPATVTEVKGIVRNMGDDRMFFNGKYIPKQHIKSFIQTELERARKEGYDEGYKNRRDDRYEEGFKEGQRYNMSDEMRNNIHIKTPAEIKSDLLKEIRDEVEALESHNYTDIGLGTTVNKDEVIEILSNK